MSDPTEPAANDRGPTPDLDVPPDDGPEHDAWEKPVFDEHEEWPEMLRGCESKPVKLDHHAALSNRFASVRTVERDGSPFAFDPAWRTTERREP